MLFGIGAGRKGSVLLCSSFFPSQWFKDRLYQRFIRMLATCLLKKYDFSINANLLMFLFLSIVISFFSSPLHVGMGTTIENVHVFENKIVNGQCLANLVASSRPSHNQTEKLCLASGTQ